MKQVKKCDIKSTLSAIKELSDWMFYKVNCNISATDTPEGDRISVWNRIQSPANKPEHLIRARVEPQRCYYHTEYNKSDDVSNLTGSEIKINYLNQV